MRSVLKSPHCPQGPLRVQSTARLSVQNQCRQATPPGPYRASFNNSSLFAHLPSSLMAFDVYLSSCARTQNAAALVYDPPFGLSDSKHFIKQQYCKTRVGGIRSRPPSFSDLSPMESTTQCPETRGCIRHLVLSPTHTHPHAFRSKPGNREGSHLCSQYFPNRLLACGAEKYHATLVYYAARPNRHTTRQCGFPCL